MRFFSLFAMAGTLITTASAQVLSGDVCTNVAVVVPVTGGTSITVGQSVCVCLTGGAINQDSLVSLGASIKTNSLAATLLPALGVNSFSSNNAIGTAAVNVLNLLQLANNNRANCPAQPTSATGETCSTSDNCGTPTCPTASPNLCPANTANPNGYCAAACPVAPTARRRRRDDRTMAADLQCALGQTACGLPGAKYWTGREFECIDTRSDIESCGGCAFPLPGRAAGQDCTAIPNAAAVGCRRGGCYVESCVRGFHLSPAGTQCLPDVDAEAEASLVGQVVGAAAQVNLGTWKRGNGSESPKIASRQVKASDVRAGKRATDASHYRIQ